MDPRDKRFPTCALLPPPPSQQLLVRSPGLSRNVSICRATDAVVATEPHAATTEGAVAAATASVVGLRPDPTGCNGAVENVLSLDGGAACSGRKERSDRGHVC